MISVDIILLSCVAGAIRSFFQKCNVQFPDDILVCIRTDARSQHTKLQLDNKFALAFIKLPVGTEGTILEYIDSFPFAVHLVDNYSKSFIKPDIRYPMLVHCSPPPPLPLTNILIKFDKKCITNFYTWVGREVQYMK